MPFLSAYQLENTDLSQMESYEILEAIGKREQMLMSGGVVNTERAAIAVVDEFRSAKLGKITLEQVGNRYELVCL